MKNFSLATNNGITLIVLVITIIILLLLAGLSIISLRESKILDKAKMAKQEHENEAAKEALVLKLSDILTEKLGEKDLKYLDGMKINGYDVTLSTTGRVVTMTKNNMTYNFLVDDKYEIIDLTNINISNIENTNQEKIEDLTDNLLYKVNFNELLNNKDDVKIIGSGITVDSTNTYATFDGSSGITIDGNKVDSENKLLGTSSKTISLWYRASNPPNIEHFLFSIGTMYSVGQGCGIEFFRNNLRLGVGTNMCDIDINSDTRFDNNWHFLVGIFKDGNKVQFYYDGVSFSATGTYNTLNSEILIAHSTSNGSDNGLYYIGDLADMRIYSSALTAEQVQQLYRYGKNILKDK